MPKYEVVIEDVDRRVRARRGREVVVGCLTSETVKGAALSLESVDDIERSDGLSVAIISKVLDDNSPQIKVRTYRLACSV